MLPQFIVLGPRKTGSSWLHACLAEHPGICMPGRVKEIFFFDEHFERGTGWYEAYFEDCDPARVVGEVSATYFSHPLAPERIAAVCPNARLAAHLRNPIDRARSMYLHRRAKGDTGSPLREAVEAWPEILSEGLYAAQLRRWRERFAPEVLRIGVYEDFTADPARGLAQLYRFVGVDDGFQPGALHERVNETSAPRNRLVARVGVAVARGLHRAGLHEAVNAAKALGAKKLAFHEAPMTLAMSGEDRAWLADYYDADVAETSELLGRDLKALWLDG
jgi:hypothetical protein